MTKKLLPTLGFAILGLDNKCWAISYIFDLRLNAGLMDMEYPNIAKPWPVSCYFMGRLLIKIFLGFFFINTFLSCKESKSHFLNSFIRFKSADTVIRAKYKDTSIYNIKAADTTIKLSGFFFNVLRCKVYFDSQTVIPFCDSIIKAAKSDTTRWESQNFSIINSMTGLKNFAHLQKAETESVDWITMLLDRFNPLVIDTLTKEKTQWILIEKYRSKTEGHTNYSTLTNGGDTLFIGYVQDFMTYAPEK